MEVVINISTMCGEGIKEVMKNYLFGFLLELSRQTRYCRNVVACLEDFKMRESMAHFIFLSCVVWLKDKLYVRKCPEMRLVR